MSQLDSELNTLRIRLAALEEQKRIEEITASEKEKKEFALKKLEVIIDSYRGVRITRTGCKFQQERLWKSKEKLAFLEPILDALKNIQERLEILEKR